MEILDSTGTRTPTCLWSSPYPVDIPIVARVAFTVHVTELFTINAT
jgi:hypothetical protein